jgi:hypothetical protein
LPMVSADPDASGNGSAVASARWAFRGGRARTAAPRVQEALLPAWRSRDQFEGRSSVEPPAHRIATNAALDILRRRPRKVVPIEEEPPPRGGATGAAIGRAGCRGRADPRRLPPPSCQRRPRRQRASAWQARPRRSRRHGPVSAPRRAGAGPLARARRAPGRAGRAPCAPAEIGPDRGRSREGVPDEKAGHASPQLLPPICADGVAPALTNLRPSPDVRHYRSSRALLKTRSE